MILAYVENNNILLFYVKFIFSIGKKLKPNQTTTVLLSLSNLHILLEDLAI